MSSCTSVYTLIEDKRERINLTTIICILVLSKFAYKYACSLHCYLLYSFTMSFTHDVSVASGESAEAKREGFREGVKVLLNPSRTTGRAVEQKKDQRQG